MSNCKHWEQVLSIFSTNNLGSFGRVKLSKNKETGKYVALKQLKKAEIIRLKQVDHIINENNILANASHPLIVSYNYIYKGRI